MKIRCERTYPDLENLEKDKERLMHEVTSVLSGENLGVVINVLSEILTIIICHDVGLDGDQIIKGITEAYASCKNQSDYKEKKNNGA